MSWACFEATRPGKLEVIKITMHFTLYQSILETNTSLNWAKNGSCNRAMIPSTPANQHLNGEKEKICRNGQVKVHP